MGVVTFEVDAQIFGECQRLLHCGFAMLPSVAKLSGIARDRFFPRILFQRFVHRSIRGGLRVRWSWAYERPWGRSAGVLARAIRHAEREGGPRTRARCQPG